MFDEDSCIWLIIGGLFCTMLIFMADVFDVPFTSILALLKANMQIVLTVLFVIGTFIFVLGSFSIIKSIVYKKCKNTHKVYSCCCCSLEENVQESKHETIAETTIPTNTFPHTKKVNHYYDFLRDKIESIDKQLEQGYTFSCISEEKWEIEKKEIMKLLDTRYWIPQEEETKIIYFLKTLEEDLKKVRKDVETMQTETAIDVMEQLLTIDGLKNVFEKE